MSSDQSAQQTTVLSANERLVRAAELAKLERRVRALVNDLMRGVLDAVAMASPAEIAQLIRKGEGRRRQRESSDASRMKAQALSPAERAAPGPTRAVLTKQPGAQRDGRIRAREWRNAARTEIAPEREREVPSFAPPDPFAITSPSELLASKPREVREEHGPAADSVARQAAAAASAVPVLPTILESPVSLSVSDKEVESERRPKIVLREGERLLSATGSGVVIRRDRRLAPRQH